MKSFDADFFHSLFDGSECELNENEIFSIKTIPFEQMFADVSDTVKTCFAQEVDVLLRGQAQKTRTALINAGIDGNFSEYTRFSATLVWLRKLIEDFGDEKSFNYKVINFQNFATTDVVREGSFCLLNEKIQISGARVQPIIIPAYEKEHKDVYLTTKFSKSKPSYIINIGKKINKKITKTIS